MPTNDYSKNIVYLSKAQYQELITNNTITVNGQTITYNDNDIYVTPQEEPITTVKINNTAINQNGIANIPIASSSDFGVVKINSAAGIMIASGVLATNPALDSQIKAGTNGNRPICATSAPNVTFYGLAKAAGHDEKDSTEPLGTYTDGAKAAIQNMLGVTSLFANEEFPTATAAHSINSLFMMDGKLHKATSAIGIGEAVTEGTNCEVVNVNEMFDEKANQPLIIHMTKNGSTIVCDTSNSIIYDAINTNREVVCISDRMSSFTPPNSNLFTFKLGSYTKTNNTVTGVQFTNEFTTVINNINYFVKSVITFAAQTIEWADSFSLLATKTSDLTNDSNFYTKPSTGIPATDIASGVIPDIQLNSVSIVSNGVANIPKAGYTDFGVVKVFDGYGIGMVSGGAADGAIGIACATDTLIKTGTSAYKAIVPAHQHESVFYGLAKAAGDTTMASSSNAVGTYTTEAKTAIQSMLGIEAGTTCIETVSGATPTITAQPNVRYNCGEVSTISITPPANGTCDIFFTSGSTATVMTVPNTVKWPGWFDTTALETDTIYEIMITDGVYGSVMTWES